MLTPSERRGAATVVLLLAIGAGWDLWRAAHPALTPEPDPGTTLAVPDRGRADAAAPSGAAGATQAPPPEAARGRIDLNRASENELDQLPGIGPVLARRIVEHRAKNGPFRSLAELRAVRGIGPKLLIRIAPRLTLGAASGGGDPKTVTPVGP